MIADLNLVILWGGGAPLFLLLLLLRGFRKSLSINKLYNYVEVALVANLCLVFLTCVRYVEYPNFIDHLEPSVIGSALGILQHKPLYPINPIFPFNGLLYGPLPVEILAFPLKLLGKFGIIPVSKMVGIIVFGVSGILIYKLQRHRSNKFMFLVLFAFSPYIFWVRGDSYLLLLALFGAYALLQWKPSLWLALILGLDTGLSSSIKIHGGLYVILIIIANKRYRNFKFRGISLFVLGALVGFVTPYLFLPGGDQFSSYLHILERSLGQGFSIELLAGNLAFVVMLWILSKECSSLSLTDFVNRDRLNIGAIGFLEIVLIIIASKVGAGIWHLIPLVVVHFVFSNGESASASSRRVLISTIVCFSVVNLITSYQIIHPFNENQKTFLSIKNEIDTIRHDFPDIYMGAGNSASYGSTFYRILLVDQPQIDFGSFMDLRVDGYADASLDTLIRSCHIRYFAIPSGGTPFSLNSYYDQRNLFSRSLQSDFTKNYRIVRKFMYFDVYSC
jgi:hypothetical protein